MSNLEYLPNSSNLAFVEEIYAQYLRDASSVAPEWQQLFDAFEKSENGDGDGGAAPQRIGTSLPDFSIFNPPAQNGKSPHNGASAKGVSTNGTSPNGTTLNGSSAGSIALKEAEAQEAAAKAAAAELEAKFLQERVDRLIRAHRTRGHMLAQLDPLDLPRPYPPEVDPEFYGFFQEDMGRLFSCQSLHHEGQATLQEILARLRHTYCRSIGAQFMHIDDLDVREWLEARMESTENRLTLTRDEQLRILKRLTDAVVFEEFIRRKFVGAKSFSLEGAESLIPLLDLAIEKASAQGIQEIVMGMAHRGRLNVLANIIGKNPRNIFREFEDKDSHLYIGGGDVKYHLGYSNEWKTATGDTIHLSLCFNPSHLEFVNPVALGRLRAKQDRAGDFDRERGLVLLIHGDAAFAGEGVTQETLNLSQLPAYTTGGTIHVIVNNQIGFTTSPEEARSTPYATDIAKMLQIPIFHVNGEDPEAVAQVVQLALDFRQEYKRDVVIDMYCYRRLGHNEADEPSFTQPRLYRAIAARKPVREAYLEQLLKMGEVTREEADEIVAQKRDKLEAELSAARGEDYRPSAKLRGAWGGYLGGPVTEIEPVETGIPVARSRQLLDKLSTLPEDFRPNPKIKRLIQARQAMARGEAKLDWASAEALAFASLATETPSPVHVRLSGQDCERGTFSQRHAVLHDVEDDHTYTPLHHLSSDQAQIEIYNSPLSEIGVLGFEYGYSLDCLDGLIMWEAQFGDFWNCAQVIVDQFIISAEDKWHHLSGLVMLLPHGFEGMGPEHSSARLERFLALAAEDNIRIIYPTTPAQYFHALRRQILSRWRKPLVVMTPKSLLRHIEAVSSLEDCATGTYLHVIPDHPDKDPQGVGRVLLCSGKIFYELDAEREKLKRDDVALLRVEQLYPFNRAALEEALSIYADGTPVFWVQEEPENMGAWRHMKLMFGDRLFNRLPFSGVTRPESASPATGSASSHKKEQEQILAEAFGDTTAAKNVAEESLVENNLKSPAQTPVTSGTDA